MVVVMVSGWPCYQRKVRYGPAGRQSIDGSPAGPQNRAEGAPSWRRTALPRPSSCPPPCEAPRFASGRRSCSWRAFCPATRRRPIRTVSLLLSRRLHQCCVLVMVAPESDDAWTPHHWFLPGNSSHESNQLLGIISLLLIRDGSNVTLGTDFSRFGFELRHVRLQTVSFQRLTSGITPGPPFIAQPDTLRSDLNLTEIRFASRHHFRDNAAQSTFESALSSSG